MGLEFTEYVMGVEEVFDIAMPPELLEDVRTFGTLYVKVCDRMGLDPTADNPPPNSAGWTPLLVWQRMRQLLSEQEEIPLEEIQFDSDFWDDLGFG